MFDYLQTRCPLDWAMDMLEIEDAQKSWQHAERKNMDEIAKLLAKAEADA